MTGLPSSWVETRLGMLGRYVNGRGFKETEWSLGGLPIIRIQNLTGTSDKFNRFDGPIEPRYVVEPGDLLISWSATLGAYFWKGPKAVLNQHIFRVDSYINKQFHKYLVDHVLARLVAQTHGSGMVHITRKPFEQTPVFLPPLAEQERIVWAIDEQFSRIEAGVTALDRVSGNLNRMRAAVLRAAVLGQLVSPSRSSVWEPDPNGGSLAHSLSAENARKVARAAADLEARKWPIPESWRWKKAVEICAVITTGSTPPATAMTVGSGDVPYIKVYNLTDRGILDFTVRPTFVGWTTHTTELRRSRIRPGDILINIVGPPLGKVSLVPDDYPEWNTNQAVVVFRPLSALKPALLKYWLMSGPILSIIESTSRATAGQFNVSLTTCRALPLPLPPLPEQEHILAAIEAQFSLIDSLEATMRASRRRAWSLRQSVLGAAFSGKLVNQNPKDEPASILLGRISTNGSSYSSNPLGRNRRAKANA